VTDAHDDEPPNVSPGQLVPPAYRARNFHCPSCGVLAQQSFDNLLGPAPSGGYGASNVTVSKCMNCREEAVWFRERMVWPRAVTAPRPHAEMPDDVRDDYNEAREIAAVSPRSASALLRLSLQKLMVALGEKGQNINEDIGSLVKEGLPVEVQQSLDALRVFGNNAVHPGEIDLRDDQATAMALFDVMNFIVDSQISQPRKLGELYNRLPLTAREQIERRDKK